MQKDSLYYYEGEESEFFSIFGFLLHFYGFAYILAAITFFATIYFFWRRQGYNTDYYFTIIYIIIITAFIGIRLFYIFERLIYSPQNPFGNSAWYKVWEGGLSVQGGIIVPTIVLLIWVYPKRHVIDWRTAFSIILPAVMLGLGIGRWGNFTNHEVFGRSVPADHFSVSWLPTVIKENMRIHARLFDTQGHFIGFDSEAKYYVPLFLYEFICLTVGYLLIVWVFNLFGWFKPGTTGGIFMIWHGAMRIVMESLRNESYAFYSAIAWFFLLCGLVLVIFFEFDHKIKSVFFFRPQLRYRVVKTGYYYTYERLHLPVLPPKKLTPKFSQKFTGFLKKGLKKVLKKSKNSQE